MMIRRLIAAILALAFVACNAASPAPATSYRWISVTNTAELGARIAASPSGRLEVREDSVGGLHFRVAVPGARAAAIADINDSHRCPPFCQ
jgi:hypothetical protein